MLINEQSAGVFVICVTPFLEDGQIDLDSVPQLIDFYLERGATGLTILGMMGEAPKLTSSEATTFVNHVVRCAAGHVPVVVGVSGGGLAPMRELARSAAGLGAAGVMIAPPSTLRGDQQIAAYYANAAEAIGPDIPFVVQDYPLATEVVIPPEVIVRIVQANGNCVMLKHEDWPGLGKITSLRKAQAEGRMRRISILVGNGGVFLPEELDRGVDGAMTGFSYPEMMSEVHRLWLSGDTERARDVFDAYLPLARYEQQPGLGLAVRKHVLAKRGAIRCAAVRKPGPRLTPGEIADIEVLVRRLERRLGELR
jgi:4-hydroxy-tetrahydrodipicolinate synthase